MLAMVGPPPKRMAELAWRQHGVVSRQQLLAAGAKPSTITLWVEAAHLHPAEKLKLLNRPRLTQLLVASPNRKGAGLIRELLATRDITLARAGVRRYSSVTMDDEAAVVAEVLSILRERIGPGIDRHRHAGIR